MTDQRLEELRQRWEADPGSRVFLQLAEEYRRLGRTDDAVGVLEQGLERSPNHLSAKVALGRCRLEKEEFEVAAMIFEEVLERDPTQLVANRLLVEAYLGQNEHAKAARRLDLYRLLNDGDPAIEELQARLKTSSPVLLEDAPDEDEKLMDVPAPPSPSAPEVEGEPFADLHPPQPAMNPSEAPEADEKAIEQDIEEDPFPELIQDVGRERYLEALHGEGLFEGPQAPPAVSMSSDLEVEKEELDEVDSGPQEAPISEGVAASEVSTPPFASPPSSEEELFGSLPGPAEAGDRKGGDDDQLFDLFPAVRREATPEPPEGPPAPAAAVEGPLPAEEEILAESATDSARDAIEAIPIPEAEEEPAAEPEPDSVEAREPEGSGEFPEEPEEEPATVTLGKLYLDQGHQERAQEVFRKVLDREPDNAAAQAALGALSPEDEELEETVAERPPLSAGELLEAVPATVGLTERKIHLLEGYRRRIRGEV